MPRFNWLQRTILVIAGLLLILYGIDAANGYGPTDSWRAFAMGLAALACFVLAAGPGRTTDAE